MKKYNIELKKNKKYNIELKPKKKYNLELKPKDPRKKKGTKYA